MTTTVAQDQVYAIAADVFAAMIDGDEGLLMPWDGELPPFADPLVAWVDLHGEWVGRAALTTETGTAHDLARALLGMAAHETVEAADLVDAFGEIANVVGGNVKSLLPTQGVLSLPRVAPVAPLLPGALLATDLRLAWRGVPIAVAVWLVP